MPNSAVKPLILVVEDDPAVRNLIVAALEAHGLRHMAVETAHAAIAAASSQAPSIVLLDLGLPDMDGVKVVESVRAWSGHADHRGFGAQRGRGQDPSARCRRR